jgi:S1-C subfamily serine protease
MAVRKSIMVVVTLMTMFVSGCMTEPQHEMIARDINGVVIVSNEQNSGKSGLGTGFFIDDNTIITNHHVVENSKIVKIKSNNSEKQYDAFVLGSDSIADVAVVRLKDWDDFRNNVKFTKLKVDETRSLRVGEKVFSIGHPCGLEFTVSEGIVSSLSRRQNTPPKYMIQVDNHIFEGNSGGPLLNAKGEVVAINSMMMANTGGSFGLSAPSELMMKVVRSILQNRPVKWPLLGLTLKGDERGYGLDVEKVEAGKSAAGAGVMVGDKVVAASSRLTPVQGVPVNRTDSLLNELAILDENDQITLKVIRGDQTKDITVTLKARSTSEIMDAIGNIDSLCAPLPKVPTDPANPFGNPNR